MTAPLSVAVVSIAAECVLVQPLVLAHMEFERHGGGLPGNWAATAWKLIADGRLVILLARAGTDVVGYASVTADVATWTARAFAHLDCVFVVESYRSAGVGSLLIEAATDIARSQEMSEMQWQTPDWNTGAIRFYRRMGATHQRKERFTLPLTPG